MWSERLELLGQEKDPGSCHLAAGTDYAVRKIKAYTVAKLSIYCVDESFKDRSVPVCVFVSVCVMGGCSETTRQGSVHRSCILGSDARSQAPQKIRVSTFMSLFLPSSKQLLERGGLIWLLLLLLTANVLLFVHLWHLSPQKPCCKKPC